MHRVAFIRDFERICHGETSFEQAGVVLGLPPEDGCYDLDFKHGRVCVTAVRISKAPLGFPVFILVCGVKGYIVSPSALFFRQRLCCMQITDRHIYFTWEDARDVENAQEQMTRLSDPWKFGEKRSLVDQRIDGLTSIPWIALTLL